MLNNMKLFSKICCLAFFLFKICYIFVSTKQKTKIMETRIIKAENLQKGQMICDNKGMCFQIVSVSITNMVEVMVDNSFSPRMNNKSILKKNQNVMVLI